MARKERRGPASEELRYSVAKNRLISEMASKMSFPLGGTFIVGSDDRDLDRNREIEREYAVKFEAVERRYNHYLARTHQTQD